MMTFDVLFEWRSMDIAPSFILARHGCRLSQATRGAAGRWYARCERGFVEIYPDAWTPLNVPMLSG